MIKDLNLKIIPFENEFEFPDGTKSMQADPYAGDVIAMQGFSFEELLLKHSAATETPTSGFSRRGRVSLYAPYIPARQDRICNTGEPFTTRVIADLINSLDFKEVLTLEPHSDVLPALIKRLVVLTYPDIFDYSTIECLNSDSILNVVAPDAGAIKRTEGFIKSALAYNPDKRINLIQGIKKRDIKTGKILSIEIDQREVKGECLVVDDVCAMGGTFIGIRDALWSAGAESVNLILAHADKRNGLRYLAERFKNIYVTNSQVHESNMDFPNIHITKVI